MWILESNGDFLQGKRMWLRPGKKYLFGRVKKNGVRFAIDHRTVSRKHFIITIDPAQDGDVGRIHARSKVTITDENSKAGTNIDGVLIRGKSQELTNPINSIRPGSCPHELVITWIPCILTFGLTKKEIKSGVLKAKQEQVKELDIKAISDYVAGQTTHLVAQKRNTAKGLQALIEGRHIVADTYIDTLIYASTPGDLEEEERLCSLEVDFDQHWPDPAPHLPPKGREITEQPDEAYRPNPARQRIFDKHTFIFFDQTQHDQLLPPITTGHGKALLFNATNTTTEEEVLDFVRSSSSNQSRTILVKINEVDDATSPVALLIDNLGSQLGIEPASQSDLLDAILASDASQLRRPLSIAANSSAQQSSEACLNDDSSNRKPGPSKSQQLENAESSLPILSQRDTNAAEPHTSKNVQDAKRAPSVKDENPRPPKRPRFTAPKKSLSDFDDDFNPDAIAAWEEDVEEEPDHATQARSQRVAHPNSNEDIVKNESPARAARPQSSQHSHSSEEDDIMDELLPAAAAMRKQKQLQQQQEARSNGTQNAPLIAPIKAEPFFKPNKETKLMDVREALRAGKEAEKQAAEKEQRRLVELQGDDESHKGPANLVKIVEYKLPVREQSKNMTNGYKGVEWKAEWDGRPNYKGFRRARDRVNGNDGPSKPPEKIIIPLVLARKNTFGIGDQYWDKTREDREREARERERRKRANQNASQRQIQSNGRSQRSETIHDSSDSGSESDEASANAHDSSIEDVTDNHVPAETALLQREAEGVLEHPIDVDAPRQTRNGDTQQTQSSKNTKNAKRPASKTPPGRNLGQKRQRTLPVAVVHGSQSVNDSDDSDDMKFRFGRARKGRGGAAVARS